VNKIFTNLVIAIVLIFIVGCSSTANTGNRIRRDPFFISRAEIVTSIANNAFELIAEVRNTWLEGTIMRSFNFETRYYPTVYIDNNKYGTLRALRSISLDKIIEIEFLRPTDAISRYGADHSGGAIFVKMIK